MASKPAISSAQKSAPPKKKTDVVKPKPTVVKAPAPSKTDKSKSLSEVEIQKKDKEDARLLLEKAKEASAKQKLTESNRLAAEADAKRKLADASQKEKTTAVEAEQIEKDATAPDVARKVALEKIATNADEKKAKETRKRPQCLQLPKLKPRG